MTTAKDRVLSWGSDANYMRYHLPFAHMVGVNESIMLSKLIQQHEYWEERGELTESGAYFFSVQDMQKHTAIKEGAQRKAIKVLQEKDLLFSFRDGMPAKRYFLLNFVKIDEAMQEARNLFRRNDGTGNGAAETSKKDEKPRHVKNLQNGGTRTAEIAEHEPPFQQSKIKSYKKDLKLNKDRQTEGNRLADILIQMGYPERGAIEFALNFEQNEKIPLGSYSDDDVIFCVNDSLERSQNPLPGKEPIARPYIWAARKLQYLIEDRQTAAAHPVQPKPQKQRAAAGRGGRVEKVPSWFGKQEEEEKLSPAEQAAFEAEKRQLEEALRKRGE